MIYGAYHLLSEAQREMCQPLIVITVVELRVIKVGRAREVIAWCAVYENKIFLNYPSRPIIFFSKRTTFFLIR